MLAKPQRLRRMRDFALLSQRGRPVFSASFTLRFRQSQEATKVGFVASNKLFRRANKRNRAKRRLRALLREVQPQWPEKMDLLFILRPETLTLPYAELKTAVLRVFEKIPEALTQPVKPKKMKARKKTSVIYREQA
jgi:ribonuclease P protein component